MERPRAGCGRHEILSELSSSLVRNVRKRFTDTLTWEERGMRL